MIFIKCAAFVYFNGKTGEARVSSFQGQAFKHLEQRFSIQMSLGFPRFETGSLQ